MAWSSRGALTRIGDCSWLTSMIVRGLAPSPVKSRKVALVNCSCLWVTSLVGKFLRRLLWARCVIPISYRTAKCWLTQRGLACRQACEPQEKIGASLISWISPGDWLVFILWLVHPSMRWYNYPTLSSTSRKLVVMLFSVASLWELVSLVSVAL